MRASANDAGAFVNLLNDEMDGLLKASALNFGRMLFGDGSGRLGRALTANDGNNVKVNNKYFMTGMLVEIYDEKGAPTALGKRRIVDWDPVNCIVTLDGTLAADAIKSGYAFYVQGSKDGEITGLSALFKDSGTIYGLDRSQHKWLVPYMQSNVGEISETIIQRAIDYLEENAGSKVNFIVCSSGVKRAFMKHLATYKRNTDVMDLKGGFKALSFNGIPIVSDRFCPVGTMYLLNTDDFTLHQLCDWKWLEGEDGKILKQNAGKPTYTATLVKYADLICSKPCGQAMLSGIAEE